MPNRVSVSSGGGSEPAVRTYGAAGPPLVVVHGGPGAPGYMAPVCRRLAEEYAVFEPLQRLSGDTPLTVTGHVSDLRALVAQHVGNDPVTLVGHSWGAMLVLACAAEYPGLARSIVLIGCGTFDSRLRQVFESTVEQRLTPAIRKRLQQLPRTVSDLDVRMCVTARLLEAAYSYDLEPHMDETEYHDSRGHDESWRDMLRLQLEGVYPARFSHIATPVLMLHGADDPHPGREIFASLRRVIPHLEYIELVHCGHYPWWETFAREPFYEVLLGWIGSHHT